MTTATRQIAFINAAHTITHYSLLILPTAVLAMARPGGAFRRRLRPDHGAGDRHVRALRPVLAAAGLACATVGRKALMSVFFLGTGLALIGGGLADSPLMLASRWLAGLFAAIYHPIGTAMLVDAAGDKPGRVDRHQRRVRQFRRGAGARSSPPSWPPSSAGAPPSSHPARCASRSGCCGCASRRFDHAAARRRARPFPAIPRALVRRAVISLLLIAVVVGAGVQRLHHPAAEADAGTAGRHVGLLTLSAFAAFVVTLCGALTQFSVGRMIDRTTLKRVFLPLGLVLAPALTALSFAQGWWCCRWRTRWRRRCSAR